MEGNNSIGLTDAMPISDEMGKNQNNYFEFDISSKTNFTNSKYNNATFTSSVNVYAKKEEK